MVSIPWRLADARLLGDLAHDVRAGYPADSADHAAAVCVLAYRYLADPQADAQAGAELLGQLAAIDRRPPANPHVLRWQISGAYVAGLISQRLGDHESALGWFRRCAACDCREFSPTLGTKTIAAAWQAGRLLAQRGDAAGARRELDRGIEIFFGLFRDGRTALLGNAKRPFDFPYFELTEIAAAVTSCINLLRQLDEAPGGTPPAVAVENLQSVIISLRAELSRWQAAHQNCQVHLNKARVALAEADRHWSIRVLRKTHRFLRKLVHRP
jgi:tetratricopeptide (TPR) repeat protein